MSATPNRPAPTVVPLTSRERMQKGARIAGLVLTLAILIIWALMTLLPMYWMFTGAFKDSYALRKMPPDWWPKKPSLDNFQILFQGTEIGRWFLNSAFVSLTLTFTNLFFGSMAGYAFAKMRFPGRNKIFWILLSTMMIPSQCTLIPLYLLVTKTLGWRDTYTALIVPNLVSVWNIFMMKQFIQTLPATLIDAARVDACSEFGIWYKIIVPLTKPAMAVLGISAFVGHWGEFFWPLLVANAPKMRLLQNGLATFRFENEISYGPMMAGAVLSAIPIMIIFFAFQKYFLQGLTVGAVKG